MNKKNISGVVAMATATVALLGFAAFLLIGKYPDVLITAQDRNVFAGDAMYFNEAIARPFGLFQYLGGFMTQYFYTPAVGALMLIAIWAATVFVGIKAFRLKGAWQSLMLIPVACLLASEVDLGYWVYCLSIPGYWFSQSLGYLCMLLLLWAARVTPRRIRVVWYVVVGFVLFPVLGWFSYFFTICLALLQFRKSEEKKATPTWIDGIGMVLSFVAPLIFRAMLYGSVNDDVVFEAGFPFFQTATDEALRPTIPFFVLIAVTLLCPIISALAERKQVANRLAGVFTMGMPLVVVVCSAYYVWSCSFKDDNYLYEMQMNQATMNDDWQKVISVAEKTKHPSRTMVMLKNIALMNTGQLGERSFELGNNGLEIYNPDSLNISLMHIASPTIYYNYGRINYSMRWCMEFAVPYGFSPYFLKNLARCAELSGEKKLAKRYIDRLHQLTCYKDWKPAPATAIVTELYKGFPDQLDSDDNNCERFIFRTMSSAYKKDSPLVSEIALFYSMIMRDAALFCPNFHDYVKNFKGDTLPKDYEEAYSLFVERFPERFPYRVKVSASTESNYKQFMKEGNELSRYASSEAELGEQLFERWNGTYWWFNAFGRYAY